MIDHIVFINAFLPSLPDEGSSSNKPCFLNIWCNLLIISNSYTSVNSIFFLPGNLQVKVWLNLFFLLEWCNTFFNKLFKCFFIIISSEKFFSSLFPTFIIYI